MTASILLMNDSTEGVQPVEGKKLRRRSIDYRAGRALEILGHAIEYLTDESYFNGCSTRDRKAELEAIEILMSRNREIYFSCPTESRVGERWRNLLHGALG